MKFDNIFGYYSHGTKEAVIYDGRNRLKDKDGSFYIPTLYRKKVTFETYKRNFYKFCNAVNEIERKDNE
jgi:hypothetical protein